MHFPHALQDIWGLITHAGMATQGQAGLQGLNRSRRPRILGATGETDRMAGGWTRDGAVQEQIEASIQDELARLKRPRADRPSATHCVDCEEPIPEARRQAVPGVTLCLDCQQARDDAYRPRGGINRRGSKDSQLK
jgi:phage/conjugal plasmid C-4 type zinc finger TraR family protein